MTVVDDVTIAVNEPFNQDYVHSSWKLPKDQIANTPGCTFDLDMRGKQTSASGKGTAKGKAIVTFTAMPGHAGVLAPDNQLTKMRIHVKATVQARSINGATALTILTAKRSDGTTLKTETASSAGNPMVAKNFDVSFDLPIGDFFTLTFLGDADSGTGFADFARAEILAGEVTVSQIYAVELNEATNESALHTDMFKKSFVLRRGGAIDLDVLVGPDFDPVLHELKFQALHDFDGASTVVDIPPFTSTVPHDKWGVQTTSLGLHGVGGPTQGRKALVRVNIPETAAIGEYQLQAQVVPVGASSQLAAADFAKKFPVLFNPWSTFDATFFSPVANLGEYVLSESTTVFVKTNAGSLAAMPWKLDQFDAQEETLAVTMGLLAGLGSAGRADPATVARQLTAMANSEEDSGLLVGQWNDPAFVGGVNPGAWTGSLPILHQYKASGAPVKFGQCWVFAGTLASLCRCVGLPARAISVVQAGIDSRDNPGDRTITRHFDSAGHSISARSDSFWNFHVWTETHFGTDWHLIDASRNDDLFLYKIGPVPSQDIRFKVVGDLDLNFAIAEVDGDLVDVLEDATGAIVKSAPPNTGFIAPLILTNVPGSSAPFDLTLGHYKDSAAQLPATLSSGFDADLTAPATVPIGQDVQVSVALKNGGGAPLSCALTIVSEFSNYHGDVIAGLTSQAATIQLAPGQSQTVVHTIPYASYAAGVATSRLLAVRAMVDVLGTPDLWVESDITELTLNTASASFLPVDVAPIGSNAPLSVSLTNPTSVPFTNATAIVSLSDELTTGGASSATVSLGTIAPGGTANATVGVSTVSPGNALARVLFQAAEFEAVSTEASLRVVDADCNDNQVPDAQDIAVGTSTDFNGNAVPDECECAVTAFCTVTANSSGGGATLGMTGSASVSKNNLVLVASSCPVGKPAVICVGDGQQQMPFADGYICVAPRAAALLRLAPVVHTDAQGGLQVPINLASGPLAGLVTANSNWNFQLWFRDLGGAGSGSNVTNALAITFCP